MLQIPGSHSRRRRMAQCMEVCLCCTISAESDVFGVFLRSFLAGSCILFLNASRLSGMWRIDALWEGGVEHAIKGCVSKSDDFTTSTVSPRKPIIPLIVSNWYLVGSRAIVFRFLDSLRRVLKLQYFAFMFKCVSACLLLCIQLNQILREHGFACRPLLGQQECWKLLALFHENLQSCRCRHCTFPACDMGVYTKEM